MTYREARERDLIALAAIRDTLALVPPDEDLPLGMDDSRRAAREAEALRRWCDHALTRYAEVCCFLCEPEATYDDELGWKLICPECGRTARAPTMDEAEDRWNDLVAKDREKEGDE